ncbi:MAG: TAXI family TRAP transporter solute-binding subunit [Chloroflexota bacterium]|jgi:TRAP transporter TAXI family solute receptor
MTKLPLKCFPKATGAQLLVSLLVFGLVGLLAACSQAGAPPVSPPTTQPTAQSATQPAADPSPQTSSREPVTLRTILSAFGSSAYNIGFALSDIAKKNHPWLRISPGESPGPVYNVKALENPSLWDNTFITMTTVTMKMAADGDPLIGQKVTGIRGIINTTPAAIFLATLDPNIKTPADLKGKRIGLGLKSQMGWAILPALTLEHGWGITEENADFQWIGAKPAKDALLDGRVDAAVIGMYLNPFTNEYSPTPNLVEMAASPRKAYSLSWGKEQIADVIEKTGLPLTQVTIPAGAHAAVEQDLDAWVDITGFAAKDIFPEEYAYEIVKLAAANADKFGEYDALGKIISKELLPFGWTKKTIHPGALRAYEELGLEVAD